MHDLAAEIPFALGKGPSSYFLISTERQFEKVFSSMTASYVPAESFDFLRP